MSSRRAQIERERRRIGMLEREYERLRRERREEANRRRHDVEKINVHELTSGELWPHCITAINDTKLYFSSRGERVYFKNKISKNNTPQQMRAWLIHTFPKDYYDGPNICGIGGNIKNRGIDSSLIQLSAEDEEDEEDEEDNEVNEVNDEEVEWDG